MQTIVVTDSSGVCPPAAAGVRFVDRLVVVPISVLLADHEGTDTAIDPRDVLRALRRGETVKTRAPSAIDYLDAIERGSADAAVVVTPAWEITTMWRHASNAVFVAQRPAAVVDSRSAAVGHSLVVEAALARAAAGGTLADVVQAARDAVRRVRFLAALHPIDTIARSGVVPSPSIERARSDTRRALFELREGQIEVAAMVPSQHDIVAALAAEWRRRAPSAGPEPLVGFTDDERDAARRLADAIAARERMLPFSAAMTAHTGPGALAVAWLA